jgi:hypothetical protein
VSPDETDSSADLGGSSFIAAIHSVMFIER